MGQVGCRGGWLLGLTGCTLRIRASGSTEAAPHLPRGAYRSRGPPTADASWHRRPPRTGMRVPTASAGPVGLAVLEWARSSGHERLGATVWDWNTASRRVLAKVGFTETERNEVDAVYGTTLFATRRLANPRHHALDRRARGRRTLLSRGRRPRGGGPRHRRPRRPRPARGVSRRRRPGRARTRSRAHAPSLPNRAIRKPHSGHCRSGEDGLEKPHEGTVKGPAARHFRKKSPASPKPLSDERGAAGVDRRVSTASLIWL